MDVKENILGLNFASLMQKLKTDFYINIPFAVRDTIIKEAVDSFMAFLKEPAEVKNHIAFKIAPHHRRGEIGYYQRVGADLYDDNKEFFHYHPSILMRYQDFLLKNPSIYPFMLQADYIWQQVAKVVKAICLLCNSHHPGIEEKIFATSDIHIILRFLKYEWQSCGEYLAKPHFDAGAMTLAIAESAPGLRIGSGPHNLKLVQHEPNKAIFMLSSNYKNLFPNDELFPAWHDVVQMDTTMLHKPCARWAVVAFIEAHGVTAIPRHETHKWYLPTTYEQR